MAPQKRKTAPVVAKKSKEGPMETTDTDTPTPPPQSSPQASLSPLQPMMSSTPRHLVVIDSDSDGK